MKTEREAYVAAYELFVDVVKAEKLIVVAVDAEGKQQQEGEGEEEEQVVAASPTVPYLVVL